jgi:hypothetical protein
MMNHTISEDLMPDTDEEMRRTLVCVTKETAPNAVDGNGDTQEQILDLLKNQALEDGYTAKKLEELCDSNHATVYRSIKRLEGLGQVKNIGTSARPRYAATVQ